MAEMVESKPDHLRLGSKVEVSSDEDGFQNAWLTGFICQPPVSSSKSRYPKRRRGSSGSMFWVQYDNLVTEEPKPLSENVKASFIRPLPPPEDSHQKLEPNDFVDAVYQDCWWTGVLKGVRGDKYYVDFDKPPDTLVFERSNLRLHLDWVDGTWRLPQK